LDESKADKLTFEPILGCFHGLDESQRELVLSKVFSGPDENPTDLAPKIDKTHKNKSKDS
jgi:hypothetical protein